MPQDKQNGSTKVTKGEALGMLSSSPAAMLAALSPIIRSGQGRRPSTSRR